MKHPTSLSALTDAQHISFDPNFIVKVSPSCCQLLLDNFRYTHSSVSTCERLLQFMMLEHFYWQPLSFLCRKWSVVQDTVQNLNRNHCDMIRATPSFMRHVEKQSPKVKLDLLLDDEVLKKEVLRLMNIISEYHRDLEILILCLSYFNVDTEGNSVLKKLQFLDVVFKASGTQSVRVILDSMLQCFKFMSHIQFRDTIQKCTSYLTGLQNAKRRHYPKWCSKLLQELMKVLNELDKALKSLPENTEMEKIKRDLINYLLDFFQNHLLTRDCLILHEIFYYEDTKMLSKQISVSPQLTITKALGSPQFYLKAPVEDSPVTMPCITVAYQHYLSFGKVIDLYEWMQICCESEKDSERLPLSHRQAGFMQAISEMKLIGFHKPLSQRSNSVAKLYWGSK